MKLYNIENEYINNRIINIYYFGDFLILGFEIFGR